MHSNTWLLRQTGKATYGDRLERAFHNAAPAAVSRTYTEHVYYQSANLREIPMGINGNGYHEYGVNISRRWNLDEMHTPPCCTGNQARLLPNYIHHSALRWIAFYSCCAMSLLLPGTMATTICTCLTLSASSEPSARLGRWVTHLPADTACRLAHC